MAAINWDNGQLITLKEGDTARCTKLNTGQLYALYFYNAAGNDSSTDVLIIGQVGVEPHTVTVPGTTANQGLAALFFVNGSDTTSISASVMTGQSGGNLQAFIGSVKMPVDTAGITNVKIPLDGKVQQFNKFTRFYAVPESHWYNGRITSNINTFLCVQFTGNKATVICVNAKESIDNLIFYYTDKTMADVTIKKEAFQTTRWNFQGNGTQLIWLNADSAQNSQTAEIVVQSLQAFFEA